MKIIEALKRINRKYKLSRKKNNLYKFSEYNEELVLLLSNNDGSMAD